ncbi:MAG TPA: hypothetical protein VMF58_04750 [Rhizomicrobium sp.]|nr:hypothetical protein [Rhizomicrobium sp.]
MGKRVFLAAAFVLAFAGAAFADVITYHNSNLRHGAYIVHGLTLATAANVHRDSRFSATVSGNIHAQPLFWRPQGANRGYVIVATENNAVYALNEATGAVVWQRQLPASVPDSALPCGNIDPAGITGTPVIDPSAGVLYLDALTTTVNGPRHMLYALSLADGSVLPDWPLDVQAALVTQSAIFDSSVQGERSALLFFDNNLYVNYAGRAGDCGNYRGTVIQVQTAPPSIVANWQTRARGGGIWAQGGIAGDGISLFVTTGNTHASSWSDGEAIIRLHAGLAHSTKSKDYFAPANWQALDSSDKDLGSTEALPITIASGGRRIGRLIAFGKEGNAYLTDRKKLGGIGGQIATLPVANGPIRTAPAVYQTSTQTMVAFTSGGGGSCGGKNITMLNVAASSTTPLSVAWCALFNGQGAPIVTTSDGASDAIVWAVGAEGDNLLHGYNALTGQPVFTDTGPAMAGLHRFQTIVATQSRFYIAADNTVYAFAFGP